MDSSNMAWNTALQSGSQSHDSKYEDSRHGHTGNAGIFMNAEAMPNHPLSQYPDTFEMDFATNLRNDCHTEPMNLPSQGSILLHNENYRIFDTDHSASNTMGSLMVSNYPPSQGTYSGYIFNDSRYTSNLNDITDGGGLTLERKYSGNGNEISSSQPNTPQSLLETDHNLRENSGKSKRQMPYAQLLYKALSEAQDHSMALRDIYSWFENRTDKTQNKETRGWQNSIRHNLSMNAAFEKTHRSPHREGKHCSVWKLSNSSLAHGVKSTTRYRSKTPSSRLKKKHITQMQGSAEEKSRSCRRSLRIRQSEVEKERSISETGPSMGIGSSNSLPQEFSTLYEPMPFPSAAYDGTTANIKGKALIPRSHTNTECFPYEICGLPHTSLAHYNPSEATFSSRGEALTPTDTFTDSPFPEPMTPDTMMAPLEPDPVTWDTFGDLRNNGWTRIGKSC